MKKKLTRKYMSIFVSSVVLIVSIWILLSYVFIFGGKEAKVNEPQYLINRFEQYVNFDDKVKITNQGKEIIKNNSFWVQIIDKNGNVLDAYNTNKKIPTRYDVFKITKVSMNSNAIKNQTLFVSHFTEHTSYGVIIGCDSSRVGKYNIKITRSIKEAIITSILLLIVVFVIIGILAGFIYSKSISEPVLNIIDNINSLEKDEELIIVDRKSIYSQVYDSIKKLKIRLNDAKSERSKVEKEREKWISNISHDLKNPLTTIKGYAEIMADQDYEVSLEEQTKFAEIIKRNVDVIEGLVKDLNLSRLLKEGKVLMKKEQIDVCSLLKECCNDTDIKYRDRIIPYFEDKQIFINADKNYIRRVFTNIICNAFIHNSDDVEVFVNCYEKDDVIVEISDNGKGMNKEEIENIFFRYYRGKSSKEIDGSGLGMAISYEIIKAHNGRIEIESAKKQGTKFIIYLKK